MSRATPETNARGSDKMDTYTAQQIQEFIDDREKAREGVCRESEAGDQKPVDEIVRAYQ